MSVITHNLPWFVKDLGVSIIGEKCYTTLIHDLHITDVPCLKYALSKGLGVGIVAGGAVMKVPQILLILNASSARGLSLPSYILETLSYGITLAYSVRNGFPFSTYGENAFLSLQNVVITFLIIMYAPGRRGRAMGATSGNKPQTILATTASTIATSFVLKHVSMDKLALLQMSTLPLSLFSKLPQIQQNHRSQSTGQLSAFAVVSQILGCLARVFTTLQEVNDPLVLAGFVLALVLNIVLGAQLYLYWDNTNREGREGKDEKVNVAHELKELGNGSGRRGGAAVSSGVEGSEVSMSGRGALAGSSSVLSPSLAPSSTAPSAPSGLSTLSSPSAYPASSTLSPSPSSRSSTLPSNSTSTTEKTSAYAESQSPLRVGTPPLRSGTPSGRKWSRKVD